MEIEWRDSGVEEVGVLAGMDQGPQMCIGESAPPSEGSIVIRIDSRYFRPTEVDFLMGDASKAHRMLGWAPSVTFSQLTSIMVRADIQALLNMRRCQDVIKRIINSPVKKYGIRGIE
jgi:GDPmannose 4,6-dehydratase